MSDVAWLALTTIFIIVLATVFGIWSDTLDYELKALCLEVGGSLQSDGSCLPKG